MKLKQTLGLLLCIAISSTLNAQVTIGSDATPNAGALLDLKQETATTKGLGLPRVELTNLAPTTPAALSASIGNTGNWVLDEHIGLVVYNILAMPLCGIGAGVHVWSGDQWMQLSGERYDNSGSYATDVAALKAIYTNNPGNTLTWDIVSGDPLSFAGVAWIVVCGERRVSQLDIRTKDLTNLEDVKNLPCLQFLTCYGNQLTVLDVSGCTQLTHLVCNANQLTALDLSKCTQLSQLTCENNLLTTLDLSECTQLAYISCHNNKLKTLTGVSNCTPLMSISCYGNEIEALDVSGCAQLTHLLCYNNQLTTLNLTGCAQLIQLSCYSNQLTALDASTCTQLARIRCYMNALTSLDVSSQALVELYCYRNQLSQAELDKVKSSTDYCNINQTNFFFTPQYRVGTTTTDSSISAPVCP